MDGPRPFIWRFSVFRHKYTTGGNNTASGSGALYSNTTGYDNTANGVNALYNINSGNTATGVAVCFHFCVNDAAGERAPLFL